MARDRHRRSLWQVLGIYVAASWVCLQVIDVLTQNMGLPSWVFTLTLGMLMAGLPVTAVTAYFQGIDKRKGSDTPAGTGPFTWKNVRKAAVAALAIWGVAVTGWVIQADHDSADSERNLVNSLDEIRRLTGEYKYPQAYAIARELDSQITDDSIRESVWSAVARELTLETDPPGATVFRRDFDSTDSDWLELGDFFVDIHEVTNRQFKAFVDSGGYRDPTCWNRPFIRDGQTLSFDEAMAIFVDQTGRAGPSGWRVGSYPEGEDDFPVGGVSWYEAAAYACFVGKSLPTIYHWFMAADPYSSNHVVPQSNFSGKGAASVGQYKGLSRDGVYDMAGNVREWAANPDGEARYILGGGWNDPEYAFTDAVTSPAFDRAGENGIRLVSYPDETNLSVASAPIEKAFRDYNAIEPVTDEVFEVYRQMYEYDDTPLNTVIVESVEIGAYVRERIELDAAYNDERLTVFLFLPAGENSTPPYQVVVFFPGSENIYKSSYDELRLDDVDFMLRSGRAVVYPIYKGTYERGSDLRSDIPNTSNLYRDHVIAWSQDLGRAIDYIETRPDIDSERLAYLGFSWGGAMGPVMTAIEQRFRTGIFIVGGLNMQDVQPMADPFNFLPRVTIPTFMFNGRYDSIFPVDTSIQPLYDKLGSPESDKKLTITDSNHFVSAYSGNQLISETLDWLDKYLGTVE